jgi:hypothetical protein
MIIWNPSSVRCRAAMARPNAVAIDASSSINPMISMIVPSGSRIPISGANTSRTTPCSIEIVVPPATLPSATAVRDTGATSTSLRKPNSRSHTTEMAERIAVNSTAMHRMPGNMNWRKSSAPPAADDIAWPRPVPNTNRNSSGCASEAMIRARSRKKRMTSRYQIV